MSTINITNNSPYNTSVSHGFLGVDNPTNPSGKLQLKGDNADIEINGVSLTTTLKSIQDRLMILEPNPSQLEKYAALRKAYDHYKLLEKLLMEKE